MVNNNTSLPPSSWFTQFSIKPPILPNLETTKLLPNLQTIKYNPKHHWTPEEEITLIKTIIEYKDSKECFIQVQKALKANHGLEIKLSTIQNRHTSLSASGSVHKEVNEYLRINGIFEKFCKIRSNAAATPIFFK